MKLYLPSTPDRSALVKALDALKPLPESELRDKMRHGPKLCAVRGQWQQAADRILRRVG